MKKYLQLSGSVILNLCMSAGMVLLLAAVTPHTLQADTVSVTVAGDSGKTQAYISSNGVTVVDIDSANAAGLSHNRYTQFDVHKKGLVLNNAIPEKAHYQSELAGLVAANANMSKSADVILNEVLSNNRSVLAGFTEVLGSRADVVLANPYGISCSGCGFINTDRVTLSTGHPYLDSQGKLSGLAVNRGDILINGTGLNASAQQILDLVTGSVKFDGVVNAQTLSAIVGNNNFDYARRSVAGGMAADSSVKAVYAIDSSVLGGMYAQRIHLVATTDGVGVRMLGEAAASQEDFTLSASGKIELQNALSAQRDVQIFSTDSVHLDNASVAAARNISLSTGEMKLAGGSVVASRNLELSAHSLTDQATDYSIADNNVRSAGSTLDLSFSGNADIKGLTWRSGGDWRGKFGALNTEEGTQFYAENRLLISTTTGDLNTGVAALQAGQDLQLITKRKLVTLKGDNQVIQSLNGNVNIKAGDGIDNVGVITADKGNTDLQITTNMVNRGTVHAGGSLTISSDRYTQLSSLINSGRLLTDSDLTLSASTITNTGAGWIQASKGSDIVADTLTNAGMILLSQQKSAVDKITLAQALTNSGTIQSAYDARLRIAGLDNQLNAVIRSGRHLEVQSEKDSHTVSAVKTDQINNAGILQSGGDMSFSLATDMFNTTGRIFSGGNLSIIGSGNNGYTAVMAGITQAVGELNIRETKKSTLFIGSDKPVNAGSVNLQLSHINLADKASVLSSTGDMILNTNTLMLAGDQEKTARIMMATGGKGSGSITIVNNFINSGLLFSATDLKISAPTVTNTKIGGISAHNDLWVDTRVNLNNHQDGTIFAGRDMILQAGNILNNMGVINAGHNMLLMAETLVNYRDIVSDGNMNIVTDILRNEVEGRGKRKWVTVEPERLVSPVNTYSKYIFPDRHIYKDYRTTRTVKEEYLRPVSYSPQILAGGALRINFNQAKNTGGLLSADTVSLKGKSSGASFINESLGLRTRKETKNITYHTHLKALGGLYYFMDEICRDEPGSEYCNYRHPQSSHVTTIENTLNSGIYARKTLEGSGFSLTNNGIAHVPLTRATEGVKSPRGGAGIKDKELPTGEIPFFTEVTTSELTDAISFAGVNLSLPASPNGIFIVSKDPNAKYLVESNPLYTTSGLDGLFEQPEFPPVDLLHTEGTEDTLHSGTAVSSIAAPPATPVTVTDNSRRAGDATASGVTDGNVSGTDIDNSAITHSGTDKTPDNDRNTLYSSDYLAKLQGFNPDKIGLRLGDASYENYLVRQQLIRQTGNTLLSGFSNASTQLRTLFDNAAVQSGTLQLTFGKPLSAAQQANLEQDIVWMVQIRVNGRMALAPVVYLSSATKRQIAMGGVISARDTRLELTSLENTGGTIASTDSLSIKSVADITNTSGTLSGKNVNLQSTTGSIVNTTFTTGGNSTDNTLTTLGSTGNIHAKETLSLTANKDIRNSGADILSGGDTVLTAGKDIHFDTLESKETVSEYTAVSGSSTTTTRQVGSGLLVGGNLKASAENITLAGSTAKISGNADLSTQGDINIISRDDSQITQSSGMTGGGLNYHSFNSEKKSFSNAGSQLDVGGDISLVAIGDTTIEGSNVNVQGNANIVARNLDVLAGKNTDEEQSTHESAALFENNALYSKTKESVHSKEARSVNSIFNIGGDAKIITSQDVTLQGSEMNIAGDGSIDARNVNLLAGTNYKETLVNTTTSVVMQVSASGHGSADGKAEIDMSAGHDSEKGFSHASIRTDTPMHDTAADLGSSGLGFVPGVKGFAQASARPRRPVYGTALGTGSAGVVFAGQSTTQTVTTELSHVGSGLYFGGKGSVNATDNISLQGSNVEAKGNIEIDAKNINLLAAKDKKTSDTATGSISMGLMLSSTNRVTASADFNAAGIADESGVSALAEMSSDIKATADTKNRADLIQYSTTTTSELEIVSRGSSIKSSGDMSLQAAENLTLEGSQLTSAGDLRLDARDMQFTATDNVQHTSTQKEIYSAGYYADGNATLSAKASAGAKVNAYTMHIEGQADASFNASVRGEAGIYGGYRQTAQASGSTTAITSGISAGGNIVRNASNNITDVGTQINSVGDFTQSALTITSNAAKNTSYNSSDIKNHTATLGIYGKASISGSASASVSSHGMQADSEVDGNTSVGLGVTAGYNHDRRSVMSASSSAVVSNINVGKKFSSTSVSDTRLEGTRINTEGDAQLKAGSLTYSAAVDRSENGRDNRKFGGKLDVGIKTPGLAANGSFEDTTYNVTDTTAVVGGITSSGKLTILSMKDALLQGTQLTASDSVSLYAGGDLKFDAAQSTTQQTLNHFDVKVELEFSKSKNKAGVEAGVTDSLAKNTTSVAGSIYSGGGPLVVRGGNDVTLTGTKITGEGDISLTAGKDLNLYAAHDITNKEMIAGNGKLGVSSGSNVSVTGEGGVITDNTQHDQASVTTISGGGKLYLVSQGDTTVEGSELSAGSVSMVSGGNLNIKAVQSTQNQQSVAVAADAKFASEEQDSYGQPDGEGASGGLAVKVNVRDMKNVRNRGTAIKSTGDIQLQSAGNTVLEAATLSGDNVEVNAGGDLILSAVHNTLNDNQVNVNVSGNVADGEKTGGAASVDLGIKVEREDLVTGTRIESDGNISLSAGGAAVLENAQTTAKGDVSLSAQEGVTKQTKEDSSSYNSVNLSSSAKKKGQTYQETEIQNPYEEIQNPYADYNGRRN